MWRMSQHICTIYGAITIWPTNNLGWWGWWWRWEDKQLFLQPASSPGCPPHPCARSESNVSSHPNCAKDHPPPPHDHQEETDQCAGCKRPLDPVRFRAALTQLLPPIALSNLSNFLLWVASIQSMLHCPQLFRTPWTSVSNSSQESDPHRFNNSAVALWLL